MSYFLFTLKILDNDEITELEKMSQSSVKLTTKVSEQSLRNMRKLAQILATGTDVCFITGAGLSVSSGITPYRYSSNATWSQFVVEWGMRKTFLKNPQKWWNDFWLRTHEKKEFLDAKPNPGHYAITNICKKCQNVRIVTQNIDNLHQKSGISEDIIAPVHGSLGLYKCVNVQLPTTKSSNQKIYQCPYSNTKIIHIPDLNKYAIQNTSLDNGNLRVQVPRCPGCLSPIMPLTLLFDEKYQSHDGFKWNKAEQWFARSKAMIFVGTSFSVTVTNECLNTAAKTNAYCFNFNLIYDQNVAQAHKNILWIIGKAEELLPRLYEMVCEETVKKNGKPRICVWNTNEK